MPRLVSILIPAYQSERWIVQAINSALDQTWPHKEVIVVDDGSTDETLALARKFKRTDLKVITQDNAGAAAARNNAFALAQGEYIQWLDADDLLDRQKIARQMAVAETVGENYILSSEWAEFYFRPHKARLRRSSLWADLPPLEWLILKMRDNLFMSNATWLVSRSLTLRAGPWDDKLAYDDDGDFFSRVILASEGIRFVPNSRVFYRNTGSGSVSYIGRSTSKVNSHWVSMRRHIRHLRSLEESDRVYDACIRYINTNLFYFYPERPDIMEEIQSIAFDIRRNLALPQCSWKYSWIHKCLGWDAARQVQLSYNYVKSSFIRNWDRALFSLERAVARCLRPSENDLSC